MDSYVEFPSILSVNGFCGSGKSHFIRYLINCTQRRWTYVMILSNTAKFTNDYEYLDKMKIRNNIFTTIDFDDKLKVVMQIQKNNRNRNKKTEVLIILDDVFGSIKDSKVFKRLVTTYRHYNISMIFAAQYITAAASYLREISQYVIIFNQRTLNSLKATYESYFQDIGTFKEFKKVFRGLEQYQFYFIDRKNNKRYKMICPA